MVREAILALLAKEPRHGYELRLRLVEALGGFGERLNPGQVYVTLGRLERAGLIVGSHVTQSDAADKKVYELTATGREELTAWLMKTDWQHLAPVDFHLKLLSAASTRLADPISLIDAQRRELLRRLRDVDRLLRDIPSANDALLLNGTALRLQADLRWLELCEQSWNERSGR
jgi:DNA-binding PadR family transcriptional regulator